MPRTVASKAKIQLAWSREATLLLFFLLALAGVCIYSGKNALILLLSCLILAFAWAFAMAFQNLSGLSLQRRFAQDFLAGEESEVQILLHNVSDRRHHGLHLYESFRQDKQIGPIFVPQLEPNGSLLLHYDCVFPKRGPVDFQALELRSRYPLGLFEFRAILPLEDRAWVGPKPSPRRDLLRFKPSPEHESRRLRRGDWQLNELRDRAPAGRLLWKLSAKQNKWIERLDKLAPERQEHCLQLDSLQTLGKTAYEEQLSQVLAFALEKLSRNQAIALENAQGHCLLPLGLGPQQRQALIECLASQ